MAIHFSTDELKARRDNACASMAEAGLDGLLSFRQETMFYLTGYDTFGYVYFQCLYLGADGDMFLLTRAPDLRQAQNTSVIDEIHIWADREGVQPAMELKALLQDRKLAGKTLGVEWEAYGLTAATGRKLSTALDGFCTLEDASTLVSRHRLIKSPAEIAYAKRAAELADDAHDAARALAKAGADEGDILAAMHSAVFSGGGDYAGNEFIIGSGPDALLCRYKSGRRVLDAQDQLTLEWAGAYRHYHAAMMRTWIVGEPDPEHIRMHAACREALEASEAALKPGNTMGDVFMAHAEALDAHGLKEHRMNACGYAMGTCFSPNWMDWPMFYEGNPVELAPGMTFFIHIIVFDSERGLAQTLGRSSLVTETGADVLSRSPIDLVTV